MELPLHGNSIAFQLPSDCNQIVIELILDATQLPFNFHKIDIKLLWWNCIAASLFQRCIGVSKRPIAMPRYGSSASTPLFGASLLQPRTGGFWPLTRVPALRWWPPAPLSYTRFEVLASPWCFSAMYFYAVFGFHAALTDSNDPFLRSLAAPAPHGWTPAFHAHATSCEPRSCPQDTSKQLLRRSLAATNKDKAQDLSPLNEPVDSLNLLWFSVMTVRYGLPYCGFAMFLPCGPYCVLNFHCVLRVKMQREIYGNLEGDLRECIKGCIRESQGSFKGASRLI